MKYSYTLCILFFCLILNNAAYSYVSDYQINQFQQLETDDAKTKSDDDIAVVDQQEGQDIESIDEIDIGQSILHFTHLDKIKTSSFEGIKK